MPLRFAVCRVADSAAHACVALDPVDGSGRAAHPDEVVALSALDGLAPLAASPGSLSVESLDRTADAVRAALARTSPEELRARGVVRTLDEVEFLPPVTPAAMLYVGQNYPQHAAEVARETGDAQRREISFFAKLPGCAVGHRAVVRAPQDEPLLDYEVELGVVIGRPCHRIDEEQAWGAIAGYTVLNDLSARRTQLAEMARGVLLRGKNFAGSAPMGPWIVPAADLPTVEDLEIRCEVDGELRQHDRTSSMQWSIPELVARASLVPLQPGDVIGTGTPAGVGWAHEDRERALLRPGQTLHSSIEGIGTLETFISDQEER